MPGYVSRRTNAFLVLIPLLTFSFAYVFFSVSRTSSSVIILKPVLPQTISPDSENFTQKLTLQCGNGELGNRMFFYAVLYGLSRLNNRNAYVQECNVNTCRFSEKDCVLDSLDKVFEFSLPVGPNLTQINEKGHVIKFHLRFPEDYNISPEANILVGEHYPCSVTHFLHVKEEIRREFRFRRPFQEHAVDFLEHAKGNRQNVTLVGVHVRRGSYLYHLKVFGKEEAPREFFTYALNYFRKTLPNAFFVVLSDDLDWCRKNILGDDVYVADRMASAGQDLAVLSNCQHVIFDYGTYGLWGALLAGGKAMYFVNGITDPTEPDIDLAKKMYPPEWTGVTKAMLSNSNTL